MPSYSQGFARYAAQSEAPGLWRGLVGSWCPFLGPTGLTLRDWSGHHNHGTLTTMEPAVDWVVTVDEHGNSVYALDFGTNEYVFLENEITFTTGTIVLHFTGTVYEAGSYRMPIGKIDADNYVAIYNGDTLRIQDSGNVNNDISWTPTINTWYWVFITSDTTNWKLYVDGNYLDSDGYANSLLIDAIGSGYTDGNYNFDGYIDEVRIYNRVLPEREMWDICNDRFAMWRLAYAPLGKAAGVANDLLLLQNTNLRGNLQDLRGGLM
jgi:hypothetical protein